MRAKITLLVSCLFLIARAHAADVITFSPALPKPWVVVADQTVTGTNPITQLPLAAHIKMVLNATNNHSVVISVMPQAVATTNLEQDARSWVQGLIDGIPEQHTSIITGLATRADGTKKVVETAFTVSLMDSFMTGYSRYWISQTNAIGWVAFGDAGLATNKVVLGIAGSIRVQK